MTTTNEDPRLSSRRLPRNCDTRDGCTNTYHAAYRRFMNAIAEASAAARAIEDLPLPRPERNPSPEWHLDERDTHRIVLDDVAGLLFVLRYIVSSIESVTLSCCWSQATRERVEQDIRDAAKMRRAVQPQAVPELAAQDSTKPALAVLATA